jgi:PIN domain nuclease of toxin-antitoxin system
MAGVVADTHAMLWYIVEPQRLSDAASGAFEEAAVAGSKIHVSAISLVEVAYLVEKGRLVEVVLRRLDEALAEPDAEIVVAPLTLEIAHAVRRIPRTLVSDMPDRIIVATALHLNLPLVSRDRKIRLANITTIW